MRFAKKELGFKGGFIRPNPYSDKMVDAPMYEPFWAAAEDLDFAIGFHEGAGGGMPQVGIDRFEGRGARHIITHTMEMMLACLAVIWGGVCEKHPTIRIGFLESGGGWVAPWLDRMDRHFDDQGFNDSGLKTRPSELFQRNCWISFEPVENSIAALTSQRDTLEARMRTALTNAAFGGPTASEQDLKDMIAQGRQLLNQSSALAANA